MFTMRKLRICVLAAVLLLIPAFVKSLYAHAHPYGCLHKHLNGLKEGRFTTCDPEYAKCKVGKSSGECRNTVSGCLCLKEDKAAKGGSVSCAAPAPLQINTPQTFAVTGGGATLYFPASKVPLCGEELAVPPPMGTITVIVEVNEPDPISYWQALNVDILVPPYLLCGQDTGANGVSLDPELPSGGEIDLLTGELEGRLYLIVENDLYSQEPIREELWLEGNLIQGPMLELNLYYSGDVSIPPCCGKNFLEGDINEDCAVDLNDVAIVADGWLFDLCL